MDCLRILRHNQSLGRSCRLQRHLVHSSVNHVPLFPDLRHVLVLDCLLHRALHLQLQLACLLPEHHVLVLRGHFLERLGFLVERNHLHNRYLVFIQGRVGAWYRSHSLPGQQLLGRPLPAPLNLLLGRFARAHAAGFDQIRVGSLAGRRYPNRILRRSDLI